MSTRCEIEQALDDNAGERSELLERVRLLDAADAYLRGQLDGFCKKACDHGHGCALPRHHEPADRHVSTCNKCVFYDPVPR